jgi:hypothetical protein
VPASALALFRGELSAYQASRVRSADLPSTLSSSRVPSVAWRRSDGALVLAPGEPLVAAETYSLAVLGGAVLGTVHVGAAQSPYAEREWPPHEWARTGGRWVFCGSAPAALPSRVALEPAELVVIPAAGADSAGRLGDRCFRFDATGDLPVGAGVPPPSIGEVMVDPSPVELGAPQAAPRPPSCGPGELAMGPGCAALLDDRVVVTSADAPLLWMLDVGGGARIEPALPGERFAVKGLSPLTHLTLSGTATDLAGIETAFTVEGDTSAAVPHVVINEVLANPTGPEPAQEWVELVNDGLTKVPLAGFVLEDDSGGVSLPNAIVAPGAFVLLVSESYVPGDGSDVPPRAGTPLLRVAHLGLSNGGETLRLRSPDGSSVSSFPALASRAAGVSVARRVPEALDDEPRSFGSSDGEGASPGWENHITAP